jgi:hypothetical protein
MGRMDFQGDFKPFVEQLLALLPPGGYLASGVRSVSVQAGLYDDWIHGRSRFPAAAPGTSKHEQGLAFDVGGLNPSQLKKLGQIWESWGGRWGGRFRAKDPIHFESPSAAGAKRSPKSTSKRSGARKSKPRRRRRY